MPHKHFYKATVLWTGNTGSGTSGYKAYSRDYTVNIAHKPDILGSSDPAFRGDETRHNPEDLLISSLAACHMLWYLHLCAVNKIVVVAYSDEAMGTMQETADGGGFFTQVLLRPTVTITDPVMAESALALHHETTKMCFIANSVNFPVLHQPIITVAEN